MIKFTLTGTDNNGFRHRYSIRKNEDFKKAFVKFMVDLGFESEKIKNSWKGDIDEQSVEIKIKDFEDVCVNYSNKSYDVDVFYGRFKIFIVVRTKKRVPMVGHLEKKARWIKPIKIKKIKEKNKLLVKVPARKNKK